MEGRDYFDVSLAVAKKLSLRPNFEQIKQTFCEVEAVCNDLINLPREKRTAIAYLLDNAERIALGKKIDTINAWDQALETLLFVYKTMREIAYDHKDIQLLQDLNTVLDQKVSQLQSEYIQNKVDGLDQNTKRKLADSEALIKEVKTASLSALMSIIARSAST